MGTIDNKKNIFLEAGETVEDLQCGGLRLIQREDLFKFGLDSVLLANFVRAPARSTIVELCAGSCVVSILLSSKTSASRIVGIEILEDFVHMAEKSILLNGLDGKVEIINGDIRNISNMFRKGYAVSVVANPPYIKQDSGLTSNDAIKNIARHEVMCTLSDVVEAASHILPDGGSFFMVHRPQRLTDILYEMRKNKIEPKYLKTVHSRIGQKASLILIEGRKSSGPELTMLEPVYVYDECGVHISQASLERLSSR